MESVNFITTTPLSSRTPPSHDKRGEGAKKSFSRKVIWSLASSLLKTARLICPHRPSPGRPPHSRRPWMSSIRLGEKALQYHSNHHNNNHPHNNYHYNNHHHHQHLHSCLQRWRQYLPSLGWVTR
jgi:hypothetical protein